MRRAILSLVACSLTLAACGGRPAAPPVGMPTAFDEQAAAEGFLDKIVIPRRPAMPPRPFTTGNAVQLAVGPQENVAMIKAWLAGAKRHIAIEMFNFIDDPMGGPIAELLAQKAKSGVKVQVLADFAGSNTRKGFRAMAARLRAAGVEWRTYHLATVVKDDHMAGVNVTHRKIYLADGVVGLTGGVNLRAPFDTTTQDALMRWQGPVVKDLYEEFARDWLASGGAKPHQPEPVAETPDGVRVQVAVTSPAEGRFEIRDAVMKAVAAAEREITIEQQYLWDDKLMAALHQALARKVKVRAIVPGEEDKGVFKYLHAEEMNRLVKAGGEVRMYAGAGAGAHGHLHTKYFGIDDDWVALGSCNGDTRGFMDNQELDAISTDTPFAVQVRERLFEHDWQHQTVPFVYKPSSIWVKPFRGLLELIDYFM